MERPWFDAKTGVLCLDEYVAEMPSFKMIMADGRVTPEEMADQGQRVSDLLKKLEPLLATEAKNMVTDVLCELAVLSALRVAQTSVR